MNMYMMMLMMLMLIGCRFKSYLIDSISQSQVDEQLGRLLVTTDGCDDGDW